MNKPRTRLRKVSKARAKELAKYSRLKAAFLASHRKCFSCRLFTIQPDLHHWAGRSGKLLCYVPYFRYVCRVCHDAIHSNVKWAQEEGLIAGPKEWGRLPR